MSNRSDAYENATREILDDLKERLGFSRVEGSQHIRTKPRRAQIDCVAYGLSGGRVLVECKLSKRGIQATQADAFAFLVEHAGQDTVGILVNTVRLHRGAKDTARFAKLSWAIIPEDVDLDNYHVQLACQLFNDAVGDFMKRTDTVAVTDTVHFTQMLQITDRLQPTDSAEITVVRADGSVECDS
jgi:hypothetical protein